MIGFIQNSKLRDDIHSIETSLTSGVLLERYQLHQVPSLLTLTGLTNPPHIMIMQKLFVFKVDNLAENLLDFDYIYHD